MRKILFALSLLCLTCSLSGNDKDVVNFWQFWSDINTKPVVESLVSQFERENPGIKVKITDLTWANGHEKLVVSFAAHQPPDLMELGSDWIAEFASHGLLAEVKSEFPENYLYPAKWNGNYYAIPWMLDTRVLYYNLDLLQKTGLDIPRDWDALLEACERIDALGDDYFGFGCNSAERHRLYKKFLPFLWSNGGQVLNNNGTESALDSQQALEALDFYLDLCNCGLIESQRRLEEYFRDGKIGVVISGGWLLRRLVLSPPKFKYRLGLFFTPAGDTGTSFFGGEYLAVYARSKKAAAAERLAAFLTRRENSRKLCDAAGFGFPPYNDLDVTDPDVKIEVEQLVHSRATAPTPLWVDIEQDLEDAIEAAMYGHGTVDDILVKASETIDAKLKSERNVAAK
jgi:multiple sugar transport system substrate-binding protein